MNRTFLPVSMWAREDIPSNKIIEANPSHLSNAELLSIILGSGSAQETSVELARKILAACDNKLSALAKKSANQLTFMHGVGRQKAAKIMACIELGNVGMRKWCLRLLTLVRLFVSTTICSHA